jgi:hypothetical protein
MAAHQRLGLDHITDWDRGVCIHDGRHVGYTVHPGTSLCQPNYLPEKLRRCHRQLTTRRLSNGLEYIAMAPHVGAGIGGYMQGIELRAR